MQNRLPFLVAMVIALASAVQLFIACWVTVFPDGQNTEDFRYLLSYSCHQLPERCIAISGVLLPLCSRCLGVLIGATVLSIISVINRIRFPLRTILAAVCLLTMGVTHWGLGGAGILQTSNAERLFMGGISGISISIIVIEIIPLAIRSALNFWRMRCRMAHLLTETNDTAGSQQGNGIRQL